MPHAFLSKGRENVMTLRENMIAVLNREQPDFVGDFMSALAIVPDPALLDRPRVDDGKEYKDAWGTTWMFMPGAPGAHPHTTADNVVIKDITEWDKYVTVPKVEGLDWTLAKNAAAGVDRKDKFLAIMMSGGLFERSHHLMGMEEALCAYLEEPDAMKELLRAIADYKIAYIKEAHKQLHLDAIFYHDDWGSKQNLFLPPAVWRDIIKPLQQEISDTMHELGIMYIHHADCICQPIVTDMVEIGVELWQGTIAQNDIVKIQEITEGKLAMCGGIDGPKLDVSYTTEEMARAEVRRAIDTYCERGRFFPSIPNGKCFIEKINGWVMDELDKYGHEWVKLHPVG